MNMIEVKTQDLTGDALDWAVAIATQGKVYADADNVLCPPEDSVLMNDDDGSLWVSSGGFHPKSSWAPSTYWNQCGPLIEKIKIGFGPVRRVGWVAHPHRPNAPTEWLEAEEPLVAICRAIVADKLGMVVSVPTQLVQQ